MQLNSFDEYRKMVDESGMDLTEEQYESVVDMFAEWSPESLASLGIDALMVLMHRDMPLAHTSVKEIHKAIHVRATLDLLDGKA